MTSPKIDMRANLNNEDDEGLNWGLLRNAANPGARNEHRDERHWIEPVDSETRNERERPCDGRANDRIGVVRGFFHDVDKSTTAGRSGHMASLRSGHTLQKARCDRSESIWPVWRCLKRVRSSPNSCRDPSSASRPLWLRRSTDFLGVSAV